MTLTIGLVVEGPHDIEMITPLARQEAEKLGLGETIEFRYLQPLQDETGTFEGGGWTRVVAWCQANSGSGLDTFFEPLFSDEKGCDLIIIHLDGDAADLIKDVTTLKLPPPPIGIDARIEFLSSAIAEWSAPEDNIRRKIAHAIPVMQTESWILSSESDRADIEVINSKDEFRSTYDRKITKHMVNFYRNRANSASVDVVTISERSRSYSIFSENYKEIISSIRP